MKGVKRDPSAFPDFKKDAESDKFRRHCLATAHAQQVHDQGGGSGCGGCSGGEREVPSAVRDIEIQKMARYQS